MAISDNCSEDRTPDVVDEYRERLQIVYHRNQENLGQWENWRIVAALCETPYLSLLSDDDLLAPGQLGRALSAFDAHEGAVLVTSPVVGERYPGDPEAAVRGVFLRADAQTSFSEPYVWDTTEWLALALIGPPLTSTVGSVFQYEAFRRCELWYRHQIVQDRTIVAEMALHGDVLSLSWVGGHIRKHKHRSIRVTRNSPDYAYARENTVVSTSMEILDLCEERNLPVLEFWVDQVCLSKKSQREYFLSELEDKLPPQAYAQIQDAVQERLNTKPAGRKKPARSTKPAGPTKRTGRLERWGVPRRVAAPLRAVRRYLSK